MVEACWRSELARVDEHRDSTRDDGIDAAGIILLSSGAVTTFVPLRPASMKAVRPC